MSSRQLEERQEQERDKAVAAALGISVEELLDRGYELDQDTSEEGVVHSTIVTFDDGSTESIQLPE